MRALRVLAQFKCCAALLGVFLLGSLCLFNVYEGRDRERERARTLLWQASMACGAVRGRLGRQTGRQAGLCRLLCLCLCECARLIPCWSADICLTGEAAGGGLGVGTGRGAGTGVRAGVVVGVVALSTVTALLACVFILLKSFPPLPLSTD